MIGSSRDKIMFLGAVGGQRPKGQGRNAVFYRKPVFILSLILLPLFAASSLSVPDQVSWVSKLEDALKQAATESKFVVVAVSATSSVPCTNMKRSVFPDPAFVEFSKNSVFMLVESDRDSEGTRIAREFNVREFPTFLVLNSQGREVGRLTGEQSTGQLIGELEKIFKRSPNPASHETRQEDQAPSVQHAPSNAPQSMPPHREQPNKTTPVPEAKQANKAPAAQPAPAPAKPAADENDPITRLEKQLASATNDSERDWLNLMLGMAHFQAQHWKEAEIYLNKVLAKNPDNSSAREMMKIVQKYLQP